jgi:hypothetical protein
VSGIRAVVVVLLALASAGAIIGNAFVDAYAGAIPQRAAAVWSSHPDVLISTALTDIGTAAVRREGPPASALLDLKAASLLAPLAHEPFLARGIQAQQEGNAKLAERAFLEARLRAPREAAPRYFLAQLYFSSNRGDRGLSELATLAHLLPTGPTSVAPALAAYARTTTDLQGLKNSFRNNPVLEQAVLLELSKDPANADLALRLASGLRNPDGSARDWVNALLPRLVDAGRTATAYRIWQAASGAKRTDLLFDPSFGGSKAPPPFNWSLLSDARGFAEPDQAGGLHVLYYGRDNAELASQTLLLAPGQYRLTMRVSGNPEGMLRWSITCLPGNKETTVADLGDKGAEARSGVLTIGTDCPVQRLDLKGLAPDVAKQADVTVSQLDLRRDADAPN